MADKRIDQLTAATTMGDDDLLVLQQNNQAKKLSGATLSDYIYDVVEVSNTQPIESRNKVWIKPSTEDLVLAEQSDVDELKTAFNGSLCEAAFNPGITKGSYFKQSDGSTGSSSNYARTSSLWLGFPTRTAVVLDSNVYDFDLIFYDETGTTSGTGYIGYAPFQTGGKIVIPQNAVKFGISFKKTAGGSITDSDVTEIKTALSALSYTDTSLSLDAKAADAKVVGNELNMITDIAVGAYDEASASGYDITMTNVVKDYGFKDIVLNIDNTNGVSSATIANYGKPLWYATDTDTDNGYVNNKYLGNSGAEESSTSWAISEYIPLVSGHTYRFYHLAYSNTYHIALYNADKTYVGQYGYNNANYHDVEISPTSVIAFARFSIRKDRTSDIWIEERQGYVIDLRATVQHGTLNLITGELVDADNSTTTVISVPKIKSYDGFNRMTCTSTIGTLEVAYYITDKVTIAELNATKSALKRPVDITSLISYGRTITTSGGIGTAANLTKNKNTGWGCIAVPCSKDDVFTIEGTGGSNARLWCLTDENLVIYKVSIANKIATHENPVNASATKDGYFIYNTNRNAGVPESVIVSSYSTLYDDVEYNNQFYNAEVNEAGKSERIDRFIFSSDIKNTFIPDSNILPEHSWDSTNVAYSSMTTTEAYALFDSLVTAHPDEMSSSTIGTASDGETPIKVYKFAPKRSLSSAGGGYVAFRPKVMVNCAIHGWEKAGTETLYMLLKMMFDNWDADPVLETLRWDVDWVVVPVTNPYGFDHNVRKNANGVDLNRNFSNGWDYRVSNPSDDTYQGESALSEPESEALSSLMNTERPHIGIDFHDFGQSADKICWYVSQPRISSTVPSINAYHLEMVAMDKVARHLAKKFSFLSSVDPTTLGNLSKGGNITGKCSNEYTKFGSRYAYTFEVSGSFTYEENKKRFNDNHAIMCISLFANFVAQNLLELERVYLTDTRTIISGSDDDSDEELED